MKTPRKRYRKPDPRDVKEWIEELEGENGKEKLTAVVEHYTLKPESET